MSEKYPSIYFNPIGKDNSLRVVSLVFEHRRMAIIPFTLQLDELFFSYFIEVAEGKVVSAVFQTAVEHRPTPTDGSRRAKSMAVNAKPGF